MNSKLLLAIAKKGASCNMSSCSLALPGLHFVRYNPEEKKHNPKKTRTCLQVQKIAMENGISTSLIIVCTQCGSYELEKLDIASLRSLKDNNPLTSNVSTRYRCRTLWVQSVTSFVTPSSSRHKSSSSTAMPCATPTHPHNDPPLVSKRHLATSPAPLQERRPKRPKANYLPGRWSLSTSSHKKMAMKITPCHTTTQTKQTTRTAHRH